MSFMYPDNTDDDKWIMRIDSNKGTVELAEGVIGEWSKSVRHFGDTLWLKRPEFTDNKVGVYEGSVFVNLDLKIEIKQLPIIEKLLTLPRGTELPIFPEVDS